MIRLPSRLFGAGLIGLVSLLMPATYSAAEAQDDVPSSAGLESERDALQNEAATYAATFDVTPEEGARRLQAQAAMKPALAELERAAGNRLAGIWIEHSPEFRLALRLKGPGVPAAVKRKANALPLPVSIDTGAPLSLKETQKKLDDNLEQLLASVPDVAGVGVDERTGAIVLDVATDGVGESALAARTVAAGRNDALSSQLGMTVEIRPAPGAVGDGHTYGGTPITGCTGGFAVKQNGGTTTGLLTAGHCGNTSTYSGYGTDGTYAMTFQAEARTASSDSQWHTTTHIEYPEFYASSSTVRRTVTSQTFRSAVANGDFVCHRGSTTGYSCGNVQNRSYRPTYANACPGTTCDAVWIQVSGTDLRCFPGDSGGPWFLVNSAYGVYKGQSSSGSGAGQCTWAIFTSVTYIGQSGASILLA